MAITPEESSRLSHLLRRAGFGARPSEFAEYARLGYAASVERLLHPETVPDNLAALQEQIGGDYLDIDDLGSIRQWWLYRMVHTNRPLEEKITLFWHNHFATANFKVDNPRRMWRQNETFRRYGLGSFRTLLQQMVRDPAMLVWLDGAQNHAGKPNENFAREVMELFTLGVDGGYTETDVKEAARAFTGWVQSDGGFQYNPFLHDDGYKTVLGRSGNWHSDDVIDILVRHPSTARFVCTKLFKYFVHDNPGPAELAPLTAAYFSSGYEMRAVLKAMFTSPTFTGPAARFARIKSPVEFAVFTIRSLDAPMTAVRDLPGTLALMGQDLFNPPNVKGWKEGRSWINTRTLLARVNFASTLTSEMSRRVSLLDRLRGFSSAAAGAATPLPSMTGTAMSGTTMAAGTMAGTTMAATTMAGDTMAGTMMMDGGNMNETAPPVPGARAPIGGEEAINTLWNALLPGMPLTGATREQLMAYAGKDANVAGKLPGLLDLIVALPEYQLC